MRLINTKILLIIIMTISLIIPLIITFKEYKSSSKKIKADIPELLKEARKLKVKQAGINEYYYLSNHTQDPKDMGKYVEKQAVYADTTFTYLSKNVDYETMISRLMETLLLNTSRLTPDTINYIFDSLCIRNNIYVKNAIGITADYYTKVNQWSKDTTTFHVNFKTGLYKQGEYEDINYYAFIGITPYTYWKLFSDTSLYFCIFFFLLFPGSLFYWFYLRYKGKTRISISLDKGEFKLGNIIISEHEAIIQTSESNTALSNQQHKILLLFLKSNDYRLLKEDLRNSIWPTHHNAITNMTSAINRVKETLSKAGTGYTINTDKKNEAFYILEKI